ncbi:hypothetical protein Mal64_19530 [Pseudobythopirellula maris]|uniref:Uncharacterized protein n=1 Tax=Pseudobythopirellula maris TaxID=2527991 RepID=A0A5C5ZNX5_9BACT|nr:hypothetical protein [Pseudobythopirellula maris]TWT88471.1 hypothetical protein Mal64_19530 [Pseudobythopirellula maris]
MRFLSIALCLAAAVHANAQQPVAMNDAERALAATLSGAELVGHFTVDAAEPGAEPSLRSERYSLGEVRKLENGQWMLQTRIRYGENDVTIPITLPIDWVAAEGANPTPVIVVDNVMFPGLGTYSARVMFHQGSYVGRWSGASHGGCLFGRVVEATPASESAGKTAR